MTAIAMATQAAISAAAGGSQDTKVKLSNVQVAATRNTAGAGGPFTATAFWTVLDAGNARSAKNAANSNALPAATDYNATDWFEDKPVVDIGDDYEIRATQTTASGAASLSGMALSTWLPMSTSQFLSLQDSSGFAIERFSTRIFTIEIRNATTLVVVNSMTLTLKADLFGV